MQLGEDHLIVLSLKPPEPVAQIEAENLVKLTGNIALELP